MKGIFWWFKLEVLVHLGVVIVDSKVFTILSWAEFDLRKFVECARYISCRKSVDPLLYVQSLMASRISSV